jgi:hypothetical protein
VLFLTGHARSHPGVCSAAATGASVLQKPIGAAQLLALVDGAAR